MYELVLINNTTLVILCIIREYIYNPYDSSTYSSTLCTFAMCVRRKLHTVCIICILQYA